MKCTEAVEKTVKEILNRMHGVYTAERYDDSEHIRNIKAVIEGADAFLRAQEAFTASADQLQKEFFQYGRSLWLEYALEKKETDSLPETEESKNDKEKEDRGEDENYLEYYFDHIYHKGDYPR
jgi:hypothetical protein